MFAGGVARSLGAFVAATCKGLVIVSRPLRDTSFRYGLLLSNFVRLIARSLIGALALRRIQLPHQLANADASPELNFPDPHKAA